MKAELQKLIDHCGPGTSKTDLVILLAQECITNGLNEGRAIIAMLRDLGFNTRHVGLILSKDVGNNPAVHRWWKDADGRYHLHD